MSRKTSGKFSLNPKSQARHAERLWAAQTSQNKQHGENIQYIGALQILVRQGSFCPKRVQTPAHASGLPHVPLSPRREIPARPQMQGFPSAHVHAEHVSLGNISARLLQHTVIRRSFSFLRSLTSSMTLLRVLQPWRRRPETAFIGLQF